MVDPTANKFRFSCLSISSVAGGMVRRVLPVAKYKGSLKRELVY